MNQTEYQFSIATDFPSGIATDRLQQEIQASAITIALDRIDTNGDVCSIWFKEGLSEQDENHLDSVVAAHNGVPLPSPAQPVTIDNPLVNQAITTLNVQYETIVGLISKVPSYYVEQDSGYEIYCVAERFTIACALKKSAVAQVSDFEENYKVVCTKAASKDDAFVLGTLVNRVPLVTSRNSDGIPLQSPEPRMGSELVMVTPNFCDKTTWYGESVRVTEEELSDSGDGLTFTSANDFWINLYSGFVHDEDVTLQEGPYTVEVKIDGELVVMIDPLFPEAGGDYSVNFAAGSVTFNESQAGKTITATYSYATTSYWVLKADHGKSIDIETVEAQFSKNVDFNDSINFELWGYNPMDLPNKVMYGMTTYKGMRNFVDEALGSYPVVPSIGGSDGRGLMSEIYGFPFRYGTVRRLSSADGLELRIRLAHDKPFTGEHATATFYCTVRDL